jgi:hypothetical protein
MPSGGLVSSVRHAPGAVRVDVELAAALPAERLDVPVHGAPGVGHDDVGVSVGGQAGSRSARVAAVCWDMVPPGVAKTSRVSRSRSRPAKPLVDPAERGAGPHQQRLGGVDGAVQVPGHAAPGLQVAVDVRQRVVDSSAGR